SVGGEDFVAVAGPLAGVLVLVVVVVVHAAANASKDASARIFFIARGLLQMGDSIKRLFASMRKRLASQGGKSGVGYPVSGVGSDALPLKFYRLGVRLRGG